MSDITRQLAGTIPDVTFRDGRTARRFRGLRPVLRSRRAHLGAAAKIAADDQNFADAPRVDLWIARLRLAQGRDGEARELLVGAREEFARRVEIPYLAMADALLQ